MKCVVLVGGEGTRLRPLTYTVPKQMLPIAGMSMIERVIIHLAEAGIDEVVLSLGYRPDAFLLAFPDGVAQGVRLHYAVEPEPLDTAGAIRFAADQAGFADETIVVVNGDVITDSSVQEIVKFHRASGAEATIMLTPVEDPSRFGVVVSDPDGKVRQFVEKPPKDEAPTNLVNAGTYVLEPKFLERIQPGRRVSIEREIFPEVAGEGKLFCLSADRYWLDAGTPEKYLEANLDLVAGVRGTIPHPDAQEIAEGAWAVGKTYISSHPGKRTLFGEGTSVGAGCRIETSAIGSGCTIGKNVTITGSVVMDGAQLEDGVLVEDSVIGPGVKVGRGASITGLSVIGEEHIVDEGSKIDSERVPQ